MSHGRQSAQERILVVKLADLGDALSITPALAVLRRGLPQATIHVLTTAGGAQALQASSLHDELILFPKDRWDRLAGALSPANLLAATRLWLRLRDGHYTTVVLLHHLTTRWGVWKYRALCQATGARRIVGLDNGRGNFLHDRIVDHGFGAQHESTYWLQVVSLLGLDLVAARLSGPIKPTKLLADLRNDRPKIALHPGSGAFAPARRWSVTRWAALANALLNAEAQLVLVGGPEEHDLRRQFLAMVHQPNDVLDLGGRTTVAELGGVLAGCDLFVGGDSGVLHLAAAVGTPVVAPYGPTDPHAWGPWSASGWEQSYTFANGVAVLHAGPHTTLRAEIACSPCIYRGYSLGTPQGCPDRTCLDRIGVEQMYAVVRAKLQGQEVGRCA